MLLTKMQYEFENIWNNTRLESLMTWCDEEMEPREKHASISRRENIINIIFKIWFKNSAKSAIQKL